MENTVCYGSWGDYVVTYDGASNLFSVCCPNGVDCVQNAGVREILLEGESLGGLERFPDCSCESNRWLRKEKDATVLRVKYTGGSVPVSWLTMDFVIGDAGVSLRIKGPKGCIVRLSGDLRWGSGTQEDTYPMASKTDAIVRTAVGPASSCKDDMLFDRLKDTGLYLQGLAHIRLRYDWSEKKYVFQAETGFKPGQKSMRIFSRENILAEQYHISYKPLNRERVFAKPPVGWMTWYAVRFNACEEIVLQNAKWLSENLKEYGANCVWVDWEWCHKDFSGTRTDGTDAFHPDKEKYPHGLAYVAEEIRKLGLEPALWIGFTCDSAINAYAQEHPEIVFAEEPRWCGRYYYDFSHPKYLNAFLPKALAQVQDWGYRVVKYDTLAVAVIIHEKYHNRMYDPSLTTKEAFRRMVQKTREVLGEECFMLACGGDNDGDVLWAADIFDSARVGGDVFKWEEFLDQCVQPVLRFYPLHNTMFYPDGDNLVLREEFNSLHQAASRAYFMTMLGLPVTIGDEFSALDAPRIDLLKRCLPVLDVHSAEQLRHLKREPVLKMDLNIEKPWENYHVVNIFNTTKEQTAVTVDLQKELYLDTGEYLVYDYTADRFLGCVTDTFCVELEGCESRVYAIRKKQDRPQLLSTSRHISQGAAEITQMTWEDDRLCVTAEVIAGAPYNLTVYVPEGYAAECDLVHVAGNVYRKEILPEETGTQCILLRFTHL